MGSPTRMDDYRDGLIGQRLAYTANCCVFSNGGDTGNEPCRQLPRKPVKRRAITPDAHHRKPVLD